MLKCALKPVDAADYNPPLTPARLDVVRSTFSNGVCDFTFEPAQ